MIHVAILSGAARTEASPPTSAGSDAAVSPTTLVNEYGRKDMIDDVASALRRSSPRAIASVTALDVTLDTIDPTIASLRARSERLAADGDGILVVMNLCDGVETDSYPGISVLRALEASNLPYTGADPEFYVVTTAKTTIKARLLAHSVSTSPYHVIPPPSSSDGNDESERRAVLAAAEDIGWPMIVKPSVSYASLCISSASIVHDLDSAIRQIRRVRHEARMLADAQEVYVERFLPGREFSAVVTGDAARGVVVLPVAERVFDASLGVEERILGFERYWDGYTLEGAEAQKGEDGGGSCCGAQRPALYEYRLAPASFQDHLMDLARRAYIACSGTGYGRVDIRTPTMDSVDGAMVLEVNSNCGLSFSVGSSSLASIIDMSGVSAVDFARGLVEFAVERHREKTETMRDTWR